MINYEGAFGVPGIYSGVETIENQFWWGEWKDQIWFPAVISGATRDAGNGTTTILRAGLLMGIITASGKWKEWNPTGTDGSERLLGILGWSLDAQRLGANQDRHFQVMIRGTVKADRILVPGQATFGLSGQTNEYLIRMQVQNRFLFSDLLTMNVAGGFSNIVAKTADYTVTEADNNTLFTNRAAAGAVNFTLPVTAKKGLHYGFNAVAAQNLTITAGTADTLIALGDATADSVALSTSGEIIGGGFDVYGDGTGWSVRPYNVGAGATAQTVTIAT